MKPKHESPLTQRYYVIATEKQLTMFGVDGVTSVEYIHEKKMFLVHPYFSESTEWVVDESPDWGKRFKATTNITAFKLFDHDYIRFDEDTAVYVTYACDKRIYTQEAHNVFKKIMRDIGYDKQTLGHA